MEETGNGKWMPRYLNTSIQLMNFEVEELSVFIIGCCLFLIMKSKLWILFAVVGYFIVKKMKEKFPNGVLFNWAYILGIMDLEGLPPGLSKDFTE